MECGKVVSVVRVVTNSLPGRQRVEEGSEGQPTCLAAGDGAAAAAAATAVAAALPCKARGIESADHKFLACLPPTLSLTISPQPAVMPTRPGAAASGGVCSGAG